MIGDRTTLDERAGLMRRFPDMECDQRWIAHVPVGETREIAWQLNRPGEFSFACLIPGHFEAGMLGAIRVSTR